MLNIQYSKLNGTFSRRLKKLLKDFPKHRKNIIKTPFLSLPWQDLRPIEKLRMPKKFSHIAVVGIGGSDLGAKALTSALNATNIVFLDNIDPDGLKQSLQRINPAKTLFLLISKSGETIEILSLAAILLSKAKKENFLAITDNPGSSLGRLAAKNKIPVFISPKEIPGRFSVLSIVGLLPAALSKIAIKKVQDGASRTSWQNAYKLACHQYLHYKEGKNITVLFSYAEHLADFADWYIQLISESIGKNALTGITTVKAVGVKDQHSQLQLFLDGPLDKFFIFLKPEKFRTDFKIKNQFFSLARLFETEYDGVIKACKQRRKSFAEISFSQISAASLGELFFFFELETAFLGSLLNINVENQPAVELSKNITKILLRNGCPPTSRRGHLMY